MDFNSLNVSAGSGVKAYESGESLSSGSGRVKIDRDASSSSSNSGAHNIDKEVYSGGKKSDISKAHKIDDKTKIGDGSQMSSEESSGVIYKGNFAESLDKAVEMANKKLFAVNRQFTYAIHERTKQVMLKITDSETGEVIREIPSEKNLDLFAKLQELAGIMVDEKR